MEVAIVSTRNDKNNNKKRRFFDLHGVEFVRTKLALNNFAR